MPTTFTEQTTLGRTGLKVGRLGISSSFGALAAAFEKAFERGCNYFTWGTFLRGRSAEMKKAVPSIAAPKPMPFRRFQLKTDRE